MKKLIILIVILFSYSGLYAQGKNPFEKVMEMKGVDVVYISKAMLQMMPDLDLDSSPLDISDMVGKLNSIIIINSENTQAMASVKKEANNLTKTGGYEQAMYIKDEDSRTVFYTKIDKNSKDNEILMVTEEEDEISVIWLSGEISLEDVRKMTEDMQ